MIVQLAGLPGTGKSSLAAELARRLGSNALWLDKDRIRQALFGPQHIRYTRDQDDFCADIMFQAAAWHLRRAPGTVVLLDGRTCSRAYQVEQVRQFAAHIHQPLVLIECVCPEATVQQRLRTDLAHGQHPAANRDLALYRRLRAHADPLPDPKLRLDTAQPIHECADQALSYLHR
ncbi:MAG TPA: AAA family ATPase [Pseudonocardiaceae bacterium]|jgi:predicted kinase|nr:AAA family ATPase [Pseudonocardiaceae bacterium]